jgi:hypothetical protein
MMKPVARVVLSYSRGVSCWGMRADQGRYTPFDSEGIFQHFNATHEVDFDILKRASFSL